MTFQDIPGWYDFEATYREAVCRFPSGSVFVEVGCYLGKSLVHLAQLAREYKKQFTIIGVDTCTGSGVENGTDHHGAEVEKGGGSFAGQLHRNIIECGFQNEIILTIADSRRAAELFPINSLDFVFLDAAHDYASVCRDISVWLPKIKAGGVLAGDDMGIPGEENPVWPGVKRAVQELLPGYTYKPHDSWWYEVG